MRKSKSFNFYNGEGHQEKRGVLGKEAAGIFNYGFLCSSVVMKFLLRLLDWCGRCCSFGEGGTAQQMWMKHKFTALLQYTPERFQGEKLQQM